jgi:hypothetical protein
MEYICNCGKKIKGFGVLINQNIALCPDCLRDYDMLEASRILQDAWAKLSGATLVLLGHAETCLVVTIVDASGTYKPSVIELDAR